VSGTVNVGAVHVGDPDAINRERSWVCVDDCPHPSHAVDDFTRAEQGACLLVALAAALEDVYGGDQSLEAKALTDKLADRGLRVVLA
jgi:hypothetical protein